MKASEFRSELPAANGKILAAIRGIWRGRSSVLALIGAAVLLGGCFASTGQTASATTKVLYDDQDRYVHLAAVDVSTKNAHPAKISRQTLARGLSQLEMSISHDERIPLFSNGEIEFLSRQLAAGLASATPTTDVTFASVGRRRSAMLLMQDSVTTGRAFVDADGNLNIIFGVVHGAARVTDTMWKDDARLTPYVPGSRTDAARVDGTISGPAAIGFNRRRPDWISLAVAKMDNAPPAPRPSYQGGPAGPRQPVVPPIESTPVPVTPDTDMLRRFDTLKQLLDRGLITQQEYEEKRKALLDSL